MRVIIVSTVVPFIKGGATLIVDWLEAELRDRGHEVDTLRMPFTSAEPDMAAEMMALRLMDLSNDCDRVISIRWPAHLVRHPAKSAWFIHHHRPAFDLVGTDYEGLPYGPAGRGFRDMLNAADNVGLGEARGLFTNSAVVRDRVRLYNHLDPEVLYPPVRHPDRYVNQGYGDYVFYPSRLQAHKRQWLCIDAMHHTTTPVKLVVAGVPDHDGYQYEIRDRAKELGVESKVELIDRYITEEEKVRLMGGSLAAAYIPLDEDSYGFPSLEAHHAEKAVVTCTDSGGTLELIDDRVNGRVVAPTPQVIAAAFDELYEDRAAAERWGQAGRRRIDELNINWDHVTGRLLA